MDLNLKVKLYLQDGEEKFMGIGVLWLLQEIEEQKSLRSAAMKMGISYSKAYNMVKHLEDSLGKPVLVRQKGGQLRSGAVLTPFAQDFVRLYDAFQSDCKKLLDKPFSDFEASLEKLLKT